MTCDAAFRSELLDLLSSKISQTAKILSLALIFASSEQKPVPSFAARFGVSTSTLSRHKNELDLEKISNLREQFTSLTVQNDSVVLSAQPDGSFDPTEMTISDEVFSTFVNLNAQKGIDKFTTNLNVHSELPKSSSLAFSVRDYFAFFLPTLTEDIKTRMRNHTFTFSMPLAVSSLRFIQRGKVVEKFENLIASLEGKSKEEVEEEIVKEENTKILEDYIVCLPENQEWVEKLSKVN